MKIYFPDLLKFFDDKPSITEVSDKLFQLGHEHVIDKNLLDIEITPNRGDCLSVNGIARDLGVFFKLSKPKEIYEGDIDKLNLEFENKEKDLCPSISFLKVEIHDEIMPYQKYLDDFFEKLDHSKKNFFTDVSNYLLYELGQPTHCYDYEKINGSIVLEKKECSEEFVSVLNKNIKLNGDNLVFSNQNNIINLAGIMGGASTCCSNNTRTVLIECAYFKSEEILGKSRKYNINSDSAFNFERGVDPCNQDYVLRRFLSIIKDHAMIKTAAIYQEKNYKKHDEISVNYKIIEKIIYGEDSKETLIKDNLDQILRKLSLKRVADIDDFTTTYKIPSFRSDIVHENDIAEEVARVIGYDNIPYHKITTKKPICSKDNFEENLKNFLKNKGFVECINFPFVRDSIEESIQIDNPLDSNEAYLRTCLKDSLIQNLEYNERRQKDSIKIFEISNLYSIKNQELHETRRIAIIASGRLAKNYRDFSKIIRKDFLETIFSELNPAFDFKVDEVSRENVKSKLKHPIFLIEMSLRELSDYISFKNFNEPIENESVKYSPVSNFPSISRDLSFLIENDDVLDDLINSLSSFDHKDLKEKFIFDFFINKKDSQIKIGYRFIFQSLYKTLEDKEIDVLIGDIVKTALELESVSIPGFKNE